MAALTREILAAGDDRSLAQRSAAVVFALRVFSAALAFLSQILLARWMGGFEYGVFVLVWVWVNIVGTIATLGLNTAVLRFLPEYREHEDFERLRGILFSSRVFVFAVSTILAAAGALGVYLFEDQVTSYYVLPIYLAFFCFPFYTLTDVQDGIARANNWMTLALAPQFIARPFIMLVLVGGAFALGARPTVAVAMLAAIGATWISALGQLLVVNRRLRRVVPKGPRRYQPALWIMVAAPLLLVEGFYMLLANMDVLMLSRWHEPNDVAIYFAALRTMTLVGFVSFAVTVASTHRFSQYNAAGDRERLSAFVRDSVNWTFWPSLAATIGIVAAGYPLLWLFGPDFTSGYPVMFVLALGVLAKAAVGPVVQVLNMLGHQMATARVLAFTLAINIALNALLIPVLGLMGAAVATSISVLVESVLLFGQARRRAGLHVFVWRRPDR